MSRIRTNLITNRMANGAPTVSNGLVISGVTTVTTLDLNGDLDVDGHLNADNVSIAGVCTATSFVGNVIGNVTGSSGSCTGNAATATVASSITTTASVNTSGIVTATSFVGSTPLSHRNIIINGEMKVNQHSDSNAGVNDTYAVDRFLLKRESTAANFTMSRSTTSPDGFARSLKMDCTAADTSTASNEFVVMRYNIEATDLQHLAYGTSAAKELVLSFYVRSNLTGTYGINCIQPDNSNKIYGQTYTINSANTWERKTITIPADTSGVINDDVGAGFQINFGLILGSSYKGGAVSTAWETYSNAKYGTQHGVNLGGSTSNEWYLTGVQLEVGPVVTPFEHRSFGDELRRCQRYYYKSSRWMGCARGSSTSRSFVTDFGMRLTGNAVSQGTYTNTATSGGDVVYIGSSATRQASDVTANSLGASTTSSNGSLQLGVSVGYGIGSGDNGIATGLYIAGFTINHEF